ncbi:energy transducer TonB [Sphingomonas lenta]|uniref:Energy transducer TonB n=1 Tax=Sphingomonas lenta TaxID=1141887 RepID=A0A2A2SIY4_9SPHN|nr:energy transducer TonB [Sphingomonas lenta]
MPTVRSKRPEGRAAPPNIRSRATQVVAPVPVVPLPVPPLIVTAPVAHVGSQATAGAADRVGPGTGAGGRGDGFGGGGEGDGDGGGYEGELSPPRWRSGRLSNAVLPEALRWREGLYAVEMRFIVETDGRLTGCRVVESSGWPELDANACRAMELRMRYEPAREPDGRAVRVPLITRQEWQVD